MKIWYEKLCMHTCETEMTEGDKTKEGIEGKEKTMYIQANLHFGPVLEQVRWQRLMESNLKFRK